MRRPLQGVRNIVQFNWPFYAVSVSVVFVFIPFIHLAENGALVTAAKVLLLVLVVPIFVSLAVSIYVYDLSNLYTFDWLDDVAGTGAEKIVNINAGFDETSEILERRFPTCELIVFDFYDSKRHTEPSIARARRAYPPFAGTKNVSNNNLPLPDRATDSVFAIMSAHEIRDHGERATFFTELERIITPDGKIVVVEHLRDAANLLAYNLGAFHFHTRAAWQETFNAAELRIEKEKKVTPFVTVFFLKRNGA